MYGTQEDRDRRRDQLDRAFAATREREARELGIAIAAALDAA